MPKLLCLDFDDTLLCSDKTVSEENQNVLRQVLEAGHYIAFTTGRPLRGAKKLFAKTHLSKEHCYLLCYQGGYCYDLAEERCLRSTFMEKEALQRLLHTIQEKGLYFQAFYEDGFCCLMENEITKKYYAMGQEPYIVLQNAKEIDAYKIYKVMVIDYENRAALERLRDAVAKEQFPFDSFFSSPWFYEFCPKGQNKGVGITWLAKHLGIAMKDTVAVGDEENDVSMIEAAGIGVAMCNARKEIQAHADFVTTRDHNHSGVAEAAQKYILEAQ